MKIQYKNIQSALKKYGLRINIEKDFMYIALDRHKIDMFEWSKPIIYYLLNTYEKDYFILIKGIPYCLLSDACDHMVYKKINGSHYRKFPGCKSCNYFAACPGMPGNMPKAKPTADLPVEIALELNKSCNLNCKFCIYSDSQKRMHTSYEKIKETLNNASGLDIKYVRFTGGEPLLRKDLLKILKYAKTKGFYIFLNTNATLLDNTIIKHLEKYVDNILVSLCGYSAYTEAIINSESGFIKNKFRNILKLRKSKIPHIRIGTVISKILIDNFDKYSILIKALGINDWELYRPMLPPAKMAHLPDYNIGKNDLFKLFRLIRRLRKKGINVYIANAIPFCIAPNNTYKPIMRGAQFDDGHRRLVLDPEGFFKPSYFIRENLGKNISKAWKHNLIRKINACDYLPYKCNHCIYLRWCLGGSRYMAKEYCGSYFAHDPLMAS